ncbi:hypothetical protein WAI453_006635 [Rhynchosporium graminicola]
MENHLELAVNASVPSYVEGLVVKVTRLVCRQFANELLGIYNLYASQQLKKLGSFELQDVLVYMTSLSDLMSPELSEHKRLRLHLELILNK